MQKPPPLSRHALLGSIAALVGMGAPTAHTSTSEILSRHRGPAPKGTRWCGGVFTPGGPRCNVQGTRVRNPKVAANVQMMHARWALANGFEP